MERRELKILENIFGSKDSGLKIVLIEGEEGSGKTSLLKSFCEKVSNDSVCASFDFKEVAENSFSYMIDIFQKVLKKSFESGRFGIIESLGRTVGENEKFLYLVSLISSIRKTVLIFDNVENAPQFLFNTIMYISKNQRDKKLMVILSYNPIKGSEPLKEFFERLVEIPENMLKRINLEPLTLEDITKLVSDLEYNLPKYVLEKIFFTTKGNLKRIMEVLEYLKSNKLIDENGYWVGTFDDIPHLELPSLKAYFYTIFNRFSDEEKRFLSSCSVIGERFTLDEVKVVENLDEDKIYSLLDKLILSGIITEKEDNVFEFSRYGFRDILYNNEISNLKKRYLHRKLAEFYEKNNYDYYVIGINYYYAREYDRASIFLEKAAMKAISEHRYKDAIDIFQKIYEIKGVESNELILGECYFRIGDFKNARIYYQKAIVKERKDALVRLAELEYTLGNLREAENFLNEVEREGPSKDQLFYIGYLRGAIAERRFEFKDSMNFFETALNIATELNKPEYLALIYKQIGVSYFYLGNFQKAEEMYRKSLEYYDKISDFEGMARIYNNLALLSTRKDLNETINLYDLALSYANLSGNIYLLIIMNFNMAQINFWNSNIREAESGIKIARKLSEIIKESEIRHSIFSFLSDVEKAKGNFSSALNYIDEAISYTEKMNSTFLSSFYKLKKYEILSILGHPIPDEQIEDTINIMKSSNPEMYDRYAYGYLGKIDIYKGKIHEGIEKLILAENNKDLLTFVDYIDFFGDMPFLFILASDTENFRKYVLKISDLSSKLNGNIVHLKAYLPLLDNKYSFQENEKFLMENNLNFLLLKMYICAHGISPNNEMKNKIMKLSGDLGMDLEKFYRLE